MQIFMLLSYRLLQNHPKHISFPVVISEAEFVYIPLQIFYRDMMVNPVHATLQRSPKRYNIIGVGIPLGEHFLIE